MRNTAFFLILFSRVMAIGGWRKLTGLSRFGRRFHRRSSSWDRPGMPLVDPDDAIRSR